MHLILETWWYAEYQYEIFIAQISLIYRGTHVHTIKMKNKKKNSNIHWLEHALIISCVHAHEHTHTKKRKLRNKVTTHMCRHETQPINYISWHALLRGSNPNWKPRLTYLQKNLTNSWSPLLADIRVRKVSLWSQLKRQVKLSNGCFSSLRKFS